VASGEDTIRVFGENDTIAEVEEKIDHNGYEFTVAPNWLTEMPPDMRRELFSRHAPLYPSRAKSDIGPLKDLIGRKTLPASFDWRNYNGHSYIGPIRDQGACGSCYAFGAAAAAEGTYNWAMGYYDDKCVDFSESCIMWCLGGLSEYFWHFYGCAGADWDYMELDAMCNYGIIEESYFPYSMGDPGTCNHWDDPRVAFTSWHRVPCGDIDAIKTAIMNYGVVDAAVYVSSAFLYYSSGIYEDSYTSCWDDPCYYTYTDHAVSLVGWNDNGDADNNGYWILRNSWGTSWGEDGYMRVKYRSARTACEVTYLLYGAGTPMPVPTPTPVPNYVELDASPSESTRGAAVTLSWGCDFAAWDYSGVPLDIYIAVVKDPVVVDSPSSIGEALSGSTVYMFGPGMRSMYRFQGSLDAPTFGNVSFPPLPMTGSTRIAIPANASLAGDYVFAAVFIRRDTRKFARLDGLPVENSNLFTVW
jgi:C1A family cysteine protease